MNAPRPFEQPAPPATQRVVKVRRDYNTWVARETLEDYALRFTPRSFRKWSELRVANTAFGAASFWCSRRWGRRCWWTTASSMPSGRSWPLA